MTTLQGFSRYEVSALTGIEYHRIQYLERLKFVNPLKIGSLKKSMAVYSFEDIICLMIADKYKNTFANESIKTIVDFLYTHKEFVQDEDNKLVHMKMIFNDGSGYDCVGCFDKNSTYTEIFEYVAKRCNELDIPIKNDWEIKCKTLDPIQDLIRRILDNAKKSPDTDYEEFLKRANLVAA